MTHFFTKLFLCLLLLLLLPHRSFSQIRVDTMLTMSDGKRMNTAYFRPLALTPKGGFPAVLLVHGYAGSKEDMTAIANLFALSGYYCVEYSVRGQGKPAGYGSEGEFNWLLEERLLQDAKEILQWMQNNKDINKDKIGMLGGSQGGLITWNAAVNNLPIKCFVPIVAVPNMENTCLNNGCLNAFCYNALTNGGSRINYGKLMTDTIIPLVQNDDYNALKNFLKANDLKDKLHQIKIPMFVALAWQDDLFRVLDMLDALKTIKTPTKLAIYPGGHGLPQDPTQLVGLLTLCTRFFDYWLKGKNETIMASDSAVTIIDAAENKLKNMSLENFQYTLNTQKTPITYFLAPNKKLLSNGASSINNINLVEVREYKKNVTNDLTLNFFSEQFDNDIELCSYRINLVVGSNARKYQANALLYDYNPATKTSKPITRGSFQIRLAPNEKKERKEISYLINPQYYLLRKGHQIELRIKFGQPANKAGDEFGLSPFPPQEDASDTLFSNSIQSSSLEIFPINLTKGVVENIATTKNNYSNVGKSFALCNDIVLEYKQPIKSISIYNSLGERVIFIDKDNLSNETKLTENVIDSNKINQEIRISSQGLLPGMYGVCAVSADGVIFSKILLK